MITAIFLGIAIFMFLVIIHEFGHFWTSRKFGVKVQEFGVGIPPKVTKLFTDKKWTEYTLNRIPLGWFVRLKGEDPSDESEFLAPDSFITAPIVWKLIILFGGIIANIIFAWIAFSVSFWQWIHPISVLPDTASRIESTSYLIPSYSFLEKKWLIEKNWVVNELVMEVMPNSRAEKAWIQAWDKIISINDIALDTAWISEGLKVCYGKTCKLSYDRNWTTQSTEIICGEDECLLWVWFESNIEMPLIRFWFIDALGAGFHEINAQTVMTFRALKKVWAWLFSFNKERVTESTKSLSGPVGIVKMVQVLLERGEMIQLLAFAWMISLALAIFNFLPIPALDGWRALSVLIQRIWWRKPTTYFTIEWRLNLFFFVLLMWLWIVIIFKDLHTARWVNLPF